MLGVLGDSLDAVAVQVALGCEKSKEDVSTLLTAFQKQKSVLVLDGMFDEDALHAAVLTAVSNMEETLSHKIKSSITDMISSEGPSHHEKLDVLLELVSGLQGHSDRLSNEFKLFKSISESQSRLLAIIEANGNYMPTTFIIIPGVHTTAELPPDASTIGKMRNYAKRKGKMMTKLLWTDSRIVFLCPVTLQQVGELLFRHP